MGCWQRLPHVSDGAGGVEEAAERLKCTWVPIVLSPKFGNVGMDCSQELILFRGSKMRGMMGPGWLSLEARASLLGAEPSLPLSCGKQVEWGTGGMFLTALLSMAAEPMGMGAQAGIGCCTPQVISTLTTEPLWFLVKLPRLRFPHCGGLSPDPAAAEPL